MEKFKPLKLRLVRGLPGSGKSTIARGLVMDHHYEADMYFINDDGEYVFDINEIKNAHVWCQAQTRKALEAGKSVVVSNTFTQSWELAPYINMANDLGVRYEILRAIGEYKSIHGVPDDVIARMRERFEPIDGEVFVR